MSEGFETKLGHMAVRGGFLVLDEPESGLSLMSQISLANQLAEMRADGIQVLMATHSPVLAAAPGSRIIELDETGLEPRHWDELKTVTLYRRLHDDPGPQTAHPIAIDADSKVTTTC